MGWDTDATPSGPRLAHPTVGRHCTAQRQHTPPPLHTPPTDGTADAVGDALAAPTLREAVALGDWDAALAGLAAGDWEGEEEAGDDPQPEVRWLGTPVRQFWAKGVGPNRVTRAAGTVPVRNCLLQQGEVCVWVGRVGWRRRVVKSKPLSYATLWWHHHTDSPRCQTAFSGTHAHSPEAGPTTPHARWWTGPGRSAA